MKALLLAVLLAAAPLQAAQPPRLIVEAPPQLAPVAARLRDADPARLAGIVSLMGLENPGPPIRVLLAPEGSPPAAGVSPWITGYALSEQGIVVLLAQRVPTYPNSSMEDLLRHEVAHVLVARASGGRPLPRWFHEGMAMITSLSWGVEDHSRLTLALLADRPVSLAELDHRFGGGQSEVNRAYAISGAFVRDLFNRHGPRAASEILAGVARGLSFEDAFRAATGISLEEAESSFWDRQTFWYRWVPVLTSSVTLWLGITLLALWAIRKRRRRDAALRRMWEEEEERQRLAEVARRAEPEPGEWIH